jgi:hypothetical protein
MKVIIFIDEFWDCGYTNIPINTPVVYDTETGNYELLEYNLDTSAGHPIKDEDIVRYSEETQRVQDKELEQ